MRLFILETSVCSHNAIMGSSIVWVSCANSYSGGLADVGDVGWYGPPDRKVLALLKDYVSVIRFSNTMQCEKPNGGDRVLWEKCTNLCRVYKLIMISRVPGYGHLEYLVLELLVDLITLKLICWVNDDYFNWDWVGGTFSMMFQLPW